MRRYLLVACPYSIETVSNTSTRPFLQYDHVPGDGREFVTVRPECVKVRAEDGRYVAGRDALLLFAVGDSYQWGRSLQDLREFKYIPLSRSSGASSDTTRGSCARRISAVMCTLLFMCIPGSLAFVSPPNLPLITQGSASVREKLCPSHFRTCVRFVVLQLCIIGSLALLPLNLPLGVASSRRGQHQRVHRQPAPRQGHGGL